MSSSEQAAVELLPSPAVMSQGGPASNGAAADARSGITRLTIDIPDSQRSTAKPSSQGSRWSTTEFRFYALCFALVVPCLVWVPIGLSSRDHPNFSVYAHKLSQGWIPGRLVDMSDPQYRQFRNNLISLLGMGGAHLVASSAFCRIAPRANKLHFTLVFSVGLLVVLHGINAVKVVAIIAGNWWVARTALNRLGGASWTVLAAIWIYNTALLFANDWFGGYPFGSMHASLGWLDAYTGLLPRWHINFNITMLRLISFGVDWHSACKAATSSEVVPPVNHRDRVKTALPLEVYTLHNLIAYALYPPLYIAGPIMTFNDFIWQYRQPVKLSRSFKLSYALRFASCLLTMELVLHYMYVVAIKDTNAWQGDTPGQLSMIGFWNLIVVWLKLLIPWRFFRLWALLDGIDPPENMVRCMANNYSTLGFWRSWHRSYNLWVVRYVYIPLGGSHNVVPATLCVFTFVALWHDLSFRLLAWGWLISLFILPEILATKSFPEAKYGSTWWYRHLCATGGVLNVLMMMTANLVGFAIGIDGVKYLFSQLLGSVQGIAFLAFACACLFIAIQVMFEYRETEKRQGVVRKC